VPIVPTVVQAALPIARFGSVEMRADVIEAVLAGEALLTGAYAERGANDPLRSSVRATPTHDGW
jgi:hypothetical protein